MKDGTKILIIASAIANARGARHGVVSISNVLEILPYKLKQECIEDAEAVYQALNLEEQS